MATAGSYQVTTITHVNGMPEQVFRETGSTTYSGTTVRFTPTCPAMAPYTGVYDFDGARTFTLQFPVVNGQQIVVTFTKQ